MTACTSLPAFWGAGINVCSPKCIPVPLAIRKFRRISGDRPGVHNTLCNALRARERRALPRPQCAPARAHAESCSAASRDCMRHMHMPSAMASTHSAPVSTKGSDRSMSESMPATTPEGEVTSMVIA